MESSRRRVRGRPEAGGAMLYVVIGIAFVIAAFAIWMFSLDKAAPNVTTQAYQGSMSSPSPFPTTVAGNMTVSYTVQTRKETRPSGAGPAFPPINTTSWSPASGVTVTFTLANANAKFSNGGTTITAATDASGVAKATLGPAADGTDTLSFAITVGSQSQPDSAVVTFETHKP